MPDFSRLLQRTKDKAASMGDQDLSEGAIYQAPDLSVDQIVSPQIEDTQLFTPMNNELIQSSKFNLDPKIADLLDAYNMSKQPLMSPKEGYLSPNTENTIRDTLSQFEPQVPIPQDLNAVDELDAQVAAQNTEAGRPMVSMAGIPSIPNLTENQESPAPGISADETKKTLDMQALLDAYNNKYKEKQARLGEAQQQDKYTEMLNNLNQTFSGFNADLANSYGKLGMTKSGVKVTPTAVRDLSDMLALEPKEEKPFQIVGGALLKYNPVTKNYDTVYSGSPKEKLKIETIKSPDKSIWKVVSDASGKEISRSQVFEAPAAVKDTSKPETALHTAWMSNPTTKKSQEVATAYEKVKSAAEDPSAAGDLSLIFGYMKMLDPGSTVREGEFATAQNTAGIPDRIKNAYNKAISGERLAPEQRGDFVNQAKNVYSSQLTQQKRFDSTISERAKKAGLDPENIVLGNTLFGEDYESAGIKNQKSSKLEESTKTEFSPSQESAIEHVMNQNKVDRSTAISALKKAGKF